MKKVAVFLILFGSGLAAFGISGFSGDLSPDYQLTSPVRTESPVSGALDGSLGWSLNSRLEIVIGVLSLVGGLILSKDSN
jgi:hypothetical protein